MIKAKKSLGQNFLIDQNIIDKIVNIIDVRDKNILEVGPGTGNLTEKILKKKPNNFLVVEKDYNVVVWPNEIQPKDVNDMIMSGLTKAEVSDIIHKNTYSKLSALTKLNEYKKV